MSAKVTAAQNAALDNADGIFGILMQVVKSESVARTLSRHVTNYGIA